MALLKIHTYPDEVLTKEADAIKSVTDIDQKFIDDMIETMFKERGVGLAAPQVGVLKRLIVVSPRADKSEVFVYINPVISEKKGEVYDVEGCLSVPHASADVLRAKSITVDAMDRHGKKLHFKARDFFARVIQHEVDHLDGTLFIDHLGFQARQEALACTKDVKEL